MASVIILHSIYGHDKVTRKLFIIYSLHWTKGIVMGQYDKKWELGFEVI